MRIYANLKDARSEIVRDLSRSLVQTSSRVQSSIREDQLHEAVGYSYMVHGSAFPTRPRDLVLLGLQMMPVWKKWEDEGGTGTMARWFQAELEERLEGNNGKPPKADALHPELSKYLVDGIADYTYKERLPANWPGRVVARLAAFPDNRRIYLPIYEPRDFDYSNDELRVPCTLGYAFRYRVTEDGSPHLEVHLLQRSVDFNKFWLSDLASAFYFGQAVQRLLCQNDMKFYRLQQKDITVLHHILSFHSFLQDEGEIF